MEETKRLVFSSGDANLPLWFAGCIGRQKNKELVLALNKDRVEFEKQPEQIAAMYVEEDEEKKGVAVLCTLLSEEISAAQLFMVGGECIFSNPSLLSFLDVNIPGLDVCFTLIYWLGDEPDSKLSYTENFIICYQNKITVIKDLLEINKAWLRITKEGLSSRVVLAGEFRLGSSFSMLAEIDFAPGRITASLFSADGTFPSFFDFLEWVTGCIGLGESFEWIGEAKSIFDASLCAANLTLDTDSMEPIDYMVDMKACLFGLDLEITYFGAAKLLRGTTWQQKPIELAYVLEKLLAGYQIPEDLKRIKISGCELMIRLDQKEYKLSCLAEGNLTLAGITLTGVGLHLAAKETVSLKITGTVAFSHTWKAEITVLYSQSGKSFTLQGRLMLQESVRLPEIPFLKNLLPGRLEYHDDWLSVIYEDGQLIGGNVEFQVVSPKPPKQPLQTKCQLLTEDDGKPIVNITKELPERGPVRQGDGIRWKDIRKKMGPAHLDRAGAGVSDMVFAVYLDGGVSQGPVEIGVLGLSIGYDMQKKSLRGELSGLLIDCTTQGFSLSGGIYKDLPGEGVKFSYSGLVKLKLAKWGLQAAASYAVMNDGTVAFFVFINCSLLLPVFPGFHITGIMGGLGINRRFVIPSAHELNGFPLLSMDSREGGIQVLSKLQEKNILEPAPGEYWAAIGMSFEACGLVQGKLLLAVLFGKEFQAALLGSIEISLPKGAGRDNSYAYLKILLSAILRPDAGIFYVEAAFSKNSFLISKDCHIFGQAVCAVWFGKHINAGDFVVSLGGYHPSYEVPGHYPSVKPVGFSWQVDSHISAKGNAYMALTPSCIMAGGKLELLFTLGNLRAWFTAFVNIFIGWHPFAFDAEIGVEIGVSYRLNLLFCHKTISVSLGGHLHLWGPPIGGYLRIKILFLSFSISFGKSQDAVKKTLTWKQMREKLLPEEKLHVISALEKVSPQTKEQEPWISRGGYFSIHCETAVPVGCVNIRPMDLAGVESKWEAEVTAPDKTRAIPQESGFTLESEIKNLPGALWGAPLSGVPDSGLVRNLTCGYIIAAKKACLVGEIQILNYREALVKCLRLDNPLLTKEALIIPKLTGEESGETLTFLKEIDQEEKCKRRSDLCGYLKGYYSGPAGTFHRVREEREHLFLNSPMVTL